jgi:T-complex protein 1 subunit theta
MDDVERAIENGVSLFRSLLKDPHFVPGAGSIEVMLTSKLTQEAK